MQFHILDENYTPVAVMDNDLPEAMHFNKSKLHRFLIGSADFFDFETSKLHVDHKLLQAGYWIVFRYDGRDRMLYINDIQEAERDKMMSISSLSLNLDLNQEKTLPFSADVAKPFAWYFDKIMGDTGYEIGVNEISNLTRKLSWDSEMSHRAFLQSVATQFDNAELDYEVVLNSDFTIKKRLVHIKKKIGEVRDDIELRYGDNVKTVKRSTNIDNLYTAIKPTSRGDNDVITTIESVDDWQKLDKNGNVLFFHKKGSPYIFAPQANARFGNRGTNVAAGGYIVHDYSHDKISQSELFTRSANLLEEISVPVVSYDVEGRTEAKIGDTVKIVDDGYTPQLMLEARVHEQIVSFDDATVEHAVFGNYKALESQISDDIIAKMQKLAEENAPYKAQTLTTNGLVFKNSAGSTMLTARLFKGTKEVTPDSYRWTINNVAIIGTGAEHEITAEDIRDKGVVRWSAVISGNVVAFDEVTIVDISDGVSGRGVDKVEQKWLVQSSSAVPTYEWPNSAWKTTIPAMTAVNKYLYTIERTIYTDSTTSDAITLSAVYGDKGADGADGKNGADGAKGVDGKDGAAGEKGADAWSVIMSNENVTLPANALGGVTSYANSNTVISVVYGSGTAVTPVASDATLANNQFKVTTSATNITAGTQTVDTTNKKITHAVASGMSATSGAVASITYTISVRNAAGVTSTVTKVQSFTKSEKGITGDKGVDSFTWLRYSPTSDGADMTSLPNADSNFIGVATTVTATAPSAASAYTWSQFKVTSNVTVGENLLYNPNFEGVPTDILISSAALSSTHFNPNGWGGSGAGIKIIPGTTDAPAEKIASITGSYSFYSKAIPVKAGDKYEIRCEVKTSNYTTQAGSAYTCIQGYSAVHNAKTYNVDNSVFNIYPKINGTVSGTMLDKSATTAITDNNWHVQSFVIQVTVDGYMRYKLYNQVADTTMYMRKLGVYKVEEAPLTKSTVEPARKTVGMLWQYTGTDNLAASGATLLPNTTYSWTGTTWQLYQIKSTNLVVDNGFITNAMIANASITDAKISGTLKASRIDPSAGNMLINSDFSTSLDGWIQAGSISDPWVLGGNNTIYIKDGVKYGYAVINASAGNWTTSNWRRLQQIIPVTAGQSYSASILAMSPNNTDGIGLSFEWLNSEGTSVSSVTSGTISATSMTLLKFENQTAPSGAVKMRFNVFARGKIHGVVTQVMLNTGTSVAPWTAATNNLTVLGNMIVDGSIKANKLNVDTLSAISVKMGDMIAGTAKLMDAIKVDTTNSKKYGVILSKFGLLSSGPNYVSSSEISKTLMNVVSLRNGELRFLEMGYTEDLIDTQEFGLSSSTNAAISFDTLGLNKQLNISTSDVIRLYSYKIIADGQLQVNNQLLDNVTGNPWASCGSGVSCKRVGDIVFCELVGTPYNVSITLPARYRPKNNKMFLVPQWSVGSADMVHLQVEPGGKMTGQYRNGSSTGTLEWSCFWGAS